MADSLRTLSSAAPPPPPPLPPPPAPPLPPQRYAHRATSALARFAHPFFYGSRPPSPQPTLSQEPPPAAAPTHPRPSISRVSSPTTISHKTGIPIAALDISPQRTHVIVAGREILKTIRVSSDQCVEDFNLRSAIINHASSRHVSATALAAKHKDQLAANDVKWSHAEYDRVIAIAAANGRIVIYDLARPGLELGRFHEHSRQVHKLAFNPYRAAWLLSGSQDATIRMWDLRMLAGERGVLNFGSKSRFNGNSDAVRDVRWSPADGVEFAAATDSGAIQRWDVRKDNAPLMKINAHEKACTAIDWHPDGKHVVSGSVDRQVKVWDFSSTDRRQKPFFQFRAPQAVSNVRWRPPSWSSEAQERGDWQSTQLVTSYEQEDPRIHLWDLRRPHIPYKEFDYYTKPATDMLWCSSDLLWSVTDDGIFTQTDMSFAPQVIHRRKPCAIAWSPDGNVLAFVHERQSIRKRSINFGPSDFLGPASVKETNSGERSLISQSLTDEGLDDSPAVPSMRRRHGKSSYMRGSKSLSATPPATEDTSQVVPLEKAVANSGMFEPQQIGIIGHVSGTTSDSDVFKYLAQHYSPMTDLRGRISPESIEAFLSSFDTNAIQAERVSLHRLAQTWRIVGYVVGLEIASSIEDQAINQRRETQQRTQADAIKTQNSDVRPPSKTKSLLFKGVVESQGPKYLNIDTDSASNVTTPLARPHPDSPTNTTNSTRSHLSDLKSMPTGMGRLPSSVFGYHDCPSDVTALQQTDLDEDQISGVPIQRRQPHNVVPAHLLQGRSLSPTRLREQEAAFKDLLADGQRSAPRAIAGRAGWRLQNDDPENQELLDEDYEHKVEEKRAALRDYKSFPKRPLTFDPLAHETVRLPNYGRHDSSDSFPMFSASTDSSQRAKSLIETYSPHTRPELAKRDSNTWSAVDESLESIPELSIGSPPDSHRDKKNHTHMEEHSSFEDPPTPIPNSTVHLERPTRPLPFLAETLHPDPVRNGAPNSMCTKYNTLEKLGLAGKLHNLDIVFPLSPRSEEEKPWSAKTVMREAIKHYSSSSAVDILTAAHILHKMHILFASCEDILPYEERELIFKTYDNLLRRHGMNVEAAHLRLLCAQTYPSVYDYAQQDTFINVFCFECNRPYENSGRDNRRCHRCGVMQQPCAICMSQDPPAEWTNAFSQNASHTAISSKTSASSTSSSSLEEESQDASSHDHRLSLADLASMHQSGSDTASCQTTSSSSPCSGVAITADRPRGSALWSWCQGCGHGAHTACLTTWLSDISLSEGGCPTPGCLHDCGPGPRREENRAARLDAQRRARDAFSGGRKAGLAFAKRDSWTAGESKAVERVRGMLGVASAAVSAAASASGSTSGAAAVGAGSGNGSSGSGVVSPKKVRLVTPGEQGDRQQNA
ncbi:hypothetical protein VTO42DRAFT_4545 [Malbranchea cinnamomea]